MARKSNINSTLNDVIFHSISIIDSSGTATSITNIWNVINLHESIFRPVTTGNIQVNDSINLRSKFQMKGGERIYIDFSKPSPNLKSKIRYTKYFVITSIDEATPSSEGSQGQMYTIRFCSEEWIVSKLAKAINRTFNNGAYSDYVRNVYSELLGSVKIPTNLKLKQKNLIIEQSIGPIQEHILNGYSAFEAIEYFERRSVNEIQSPFLFFENSQGFNFISISRMSDGIGLIPGGLVVSTSKNSDDQADYVPLKFNEILNFNVEKIDFDMRNKFSEISTFDVLRGDFKITPVDPLANPSNLTNKESASSSTSGDDSKQYILFSRKDRSAMGYNFTSFATSRITAGQNISPYALDIGVYRETNTDEENFFLQRDTLINSLNYTKFSACEVAGNPGFTVGTAVDINVPAFSPNQKFEVNKDPFLTGRYIITKVRHNLTKSTGLRTFISVASNSPGLPLL